MRCTANQPKQQAAINGPSGRVKAAAARLSDAASRPRRLSLYRLKQTTARTMKKVNCRVSSPPPEVHTAKVALPHTSPSAIQASSPLWDSEGRRETCHTIAPRVPAVKITDSQGAACSGATPSARQMAANSSTHKKLE